MIFVQNRENIFLFSAPEITMSQDIYLSVKAAVRPYSALPSGWLGTLKTEYPELCSQG